MQSKTDKPQTIASAHSTNNPSTNPSNKQMTKNVTKTIYWLAVSAVFLSVLDHAYLLSEHYQLHFGQASATSLCNFSDRFNCAAVAASRYAKFFGIPMALWGVSGNLVLLLLLLWHPLVDSSKQASSRRNLLLVSGGIALVSVIMGGISTFILSRLCPFCIIAYILSFLSFAFIWKIFRGLPTVSQASPLNPRFQLSDFLPAIVLGGIAFFLSFVADDQITKSFGARDLTPVVLESLQGWNANPSVNIQTVEPLVMGASVEKAKMTIVEFADFRCSHCRHAAPVLKAFTSAHPDVRLEFQVWPLDGECNTAIPHRNGASCLLARAVYCAQKLNGTEGGWKAHEFVFENQDLFRTSDAVKNSLPDIAKSAGANTEKLIACADHADTKALIEKEAAVGTDLKLQGTPSIYVNGKNLPAGQIMAVLSATYDAIAKKQ